MMPALRNYTMFFTVRVRRHPHTPSADFLLPSIWPLFVFFVPCISASSGVPEPSRVEFRPRAKFRAEPS